MQRYVSLFFLLYLKQCFGIIPITEDITKAARLAQSYDLPVVYLFLGSDWCQWSQKIINEIFASKDFESAVGNQFIFAKIDFPEINRKNEKTLVEHHKLKEKFNVESFPTLVMTDSNHQEITRISYTTERPAKYAELLQNLYLDYRSLRREYEKTDFLKASIESIQELYRRACILQCPELKKCILDKGLTVDQESYFALEKYSEFVKEGDATLVEARELRAKILQDTEGRQGVRLRLALLDFQANESNPDKAIEPLGAYIADFGKSDQNNLWKLHLIISEYFQKQGLEQDAFEHAQKSLVEAPEAVKESVRRMLDSAFPNDEKS